jgi:pSer/pThr/pTyr-binding forkhead associated (FHA) protein
MASHDFPPSGHAVEGERGTRPRLELWRNGVLAELFPLDEPQMTLGRSSSSGLRIDDDKVSRQHALVQRTGTAAWRITDLDSTNGTFVNDHPIRADHPLRDRDRIRIGGTELVFCAPTLDPAMEHGRS